MLDALLRPAPGKKTWIRRWPAPWRRPPRRSPGSTRHSPAIRLLPAFLHRARLDAVRRQAAVDGQAIDPWHLAAVLEGFRLRMDGALRIIDRGAILAAARHALDLHQWLVAPDFDQEGAVQRAAQVLAQAAASGATPLLAAATGLHAWLGGDGHSGGDGTAAATATAVAAPARRSAPPWCGSG